MQTTMSPQPRHVPRHTQPELENDLHRTPALGYESQDEIGLIQCLAHGFPTPLARWHYHDEYELHLITATSGKVFVGDWIGFFQPGQLVLTGPRLPHNWISMDLPQEGVAERDLVIQFKHEPIIASAAHIPELREWQPLLERARHGIEFFDMGDKAKAHWQRIKQARGAQRFAAFCEFLTDLARTTDYRLLSSVQIQSADNHHQLDQINAIVSRVMDQMDEVFSVTELAAGMGMSDSQFSRFFRRATGNTFTEFVNRIRINRACQLLRETDRFIADISLEVGFHNLANFNRRFLDIKGLTPSDYRKQSMARFGLRER